MRPVADLIESLGAKPLRKLVKKMSKDAHFGFSDLKEALDWSTEDATRVVWALHEQGVVDLGAQPALLDQLSEHPELAPAQTLADVLGRMTDPHASNDDSGGEDEDEDDEGYGDEDEGYGDEDEDYGDDDYYDYEDDDGGGEDDEEDEDEEDEEDEEDGEDPYWKDEDEDERDPSLWPSGIDSLVLTVSQREPEPFASREPDFAEPIRLAMAFVHLRQGRSISEELRATLLDHMARWHVNDGLPTELTTIVDGEPTEVKLCEGYDWSQPTPHFDALVEALGGPAAWAQAMLVHAFRKSWRLAARRSRPAVLAASVEQLPRLLVAYDSGASQYREGYEVLVTLRDDPPQALLAAARRVDTKGTEAAVADMFRVAAILAFERAGEPIDPEADELLTLQGVYFEEYGDTRGYVGLEHVHAALRALGPERARAVLERVLGREPYYATYAVPALAVLPEPELIERAVEVVVPFIDHPTGHGVSGWAEVGPAALPALVRAFDALPTPQDDKGVKRRDALRVAILGVLARARQEDPSQGEAEDRFLLPGDGFADQYVFDMALRTLTPLLQRLPEERAARVLQAYVEAGSPHLERGLVLLAARPVPSVLGPAFRALAVGVGGLSEEGRVRSALAGLQSVALERIDEILPHATPPLVRLLTNAWGEHVLSRFADRLPKAESSVQRLQRLAKDLPGPHTRIYVVERDEERDASTSLGRVGDVALGIGEERWPTHGDEAEPMEHVITLDLRQMPHLRGSFEDDVVGVAVFVSSRRDNEAYEPHNDEVAIVRIKESDLELGEHDPRGENSCIALRVTGVDVPAATFGGRDESLAPLRRAIYQLGGRAGGSPLWLQEDEDPGSEFLMQLDESLVDINLGDSGILYLFEDTAFWQCH
ncbi:MAG: hypothetical protein H6712_25805 [Myxococcales bacterium]|nr:hypothetical protein [Myxococcales bacterium]MCB9717291.1 hypothetical protein [Myxococcales bacterium]